MSSVSVSAEGWFFGSVMQRAPKEITQKKLTLDDLAAYDHSFAAFLRPEARGEQDVSLLLRYVMSEFHNAVDDREFDEE